MNRNKLNKVASYLAIFSGVAVILLTFLSTSTISAENFMDWKFFAGIVFIGVGVYSLRAPKQ